MRPPGQSGEESRLQPGTDLPAWSDRSQEADSRTGAWVEPGARHRPGKPYLLAGSTGAGSCRPGPRSDPLTTVPDVGRMDLLQSRRGSSAARSGLSHDPNRLQPIPVRCGTRASVSGLWNGAAGSDRGGLLPRPSSGTGHLALSTRGVGLGYAVSLINRTVLLGIRQLVFPEREDVPIGVRHHRHDAP
jgi:hypothetical protein